MRILALTNLYPPQELGGYGRSIADFVWGLLQRGHAVSVLCSNTPHLGPGDIKGPSGEPVDRVLRLKGSYENGVHLLKDRTICCAIEKQNADSIQSTWQKQGPFDGVLVGNIDLLGVEILDSLLELKVPILHHIGFMHPPFNSHQSPCSSNYKLVAASSAVAQALNAAGFQSSEGHNLPVIYPGVRSELFGPAITGRALPAPLNGYRTQTQLGSKRCPLKVCFAGLMMGSKGAHTLVEALVTLSRRGVHVEGHLAGGDFQSGYRENLQTLLSKHGLHSIQFTGQLQRCSLSRFYGLHHVCVFPSIHPEAFGIVGAEAMASGLALVSSGVGGAAEVFVDQVSGLRFQAGNSTDLADQLEKLCRDPQKLIRLAQAGTRRARHQLSVTESARQLEELFMDASAETGLHSATILI